MTDQIARSAAISAADRPWVGGEQRVQGMERDGVREQGPAGDPAVQAADR
ncbi:hypothetical protein [Pseudonocardia xishanensis]